MQLTLWTYEGPPHVGAMRIATAMQGVHFVLHAPQGDTYADLLFTMIERLPRRPPVTYTTFQARDLGGDTAALFKTAVSDAYQRFQPQAMMVGASCTAELIQDDPGGLSAALNLPVPVVALELPSYQRKENWGASETFYQLVRQLSPSAAPAQVRAAGARPLCNILGPCALGFRHRDDLKEITGLLHAMGVDVNVVAPWAKTSPFAMPLGIVPAWRSNSPLRKETWPDLSSTKSADATDPSLGTHEHEIQSFLRRNGCASRWSMGRLQT
jgi:light-independent protochlorophyllide reductase subunit B